MFKQRQFLPVFPRLWLAGACATALFIAGFIPTAFTQTATGKGLTGNMELGRLLELLNQMERRMNARLNNLEAAQSAMDKRIWALENCVLECRIKVRAAGGHGLENFSYTPWSTSCQHPHHSTVNEFALEVRCRAPSAG